MSTCPDLPPSSRLPGLHRLQRHQRLARLAAFCGLTAGQLGVLGDADALTLERAEQMVENLIGRIALPLGVAPNFRLDGRDLLVPMAVEEPSVIAAAGNAARLLRGGPGIVSEADPPHMIGQIQLLGADPAAGERLRSARSLLLAAIDALVPRLVARGGGARDLWWRAHPETEAGPMLIVGFALDVRDAMGANLVNQVAEGLAPRLATLTGGRPLLRILSNLADRRRVRVEGRVPLERLVAQLRCPLRPAELGARLVAASVFAERDPHRAATHNKGFMNGVDAVLLATGQDWRAVEAGAHAWACREGRYGALARWRVEGEALVGRAELPMQVGTVGGAVRHHPVAALALRILGVEGADALGRVAAAVGLAQNLGALLALSTEGIQRGHMALHRRKQA